MTKKERPTAKNIIKNLMKKPPINNIEELVFLSVFKLLEETINKTKLTNPHIKPIAKLVDK